LHWGWWVVGLVLADQALKQWIAVTLELGERLRLAAGVYLTRAHNTGAAFSLLHDGGGWQRWFFVLLALGVAVAIVLWLRQRPDAPPLLRAGLVLILAGALGNLIDRIGWGYVIDFMLVYLGNWPFPAFNLADAAITVGAVLVVLDGLLPARLPPR
jgi:signal peptidase II